MAIIHCQRQDIHSNGTIVRQTAPLPHTEAIAICRTVPPDFRNCAQSLHLDTRFDSRVGPELHVPRSEVYTRMIATTTPVDIDPVAALSSVALNARAAKYVTRIARSGISLRDREARAFEALAKSLSRPGSSA